MLLCAYSFSCLAADECDYYNRHVILLVDETKGGQNEETGKKIIELFKDGGELSEGNSFEPINPEQDELSVYVFGLTGEQCESINSEIRNEIFKPNKFFDSLANRLIYHRESLRESDKTLGAFCEDNIKNLFNGNDPLRKEMITSPQSQLGPVTLSQYAQECLLSRFSGYLKNEGLPPAKEYILIMVSNFRSGIDDKNSSADRDRIMELAGTRNRENQYVTQFEKDCNAAIDGLNIIGPSEFSRSNDDVVANIYRIIPDALLNSSAYVAKGLDVKQESYGGTEYTVKDISIAFPHRQDNFPVEKIVMRARTSANEYTLPQIWDEHTIESCYDSVSQTYNIKNVSHYDLLSKIKDNESVEFIFLLFGEAKNNGSTLLPFVVEASQTVTANTIKFKQPPTTMAQIIRIIIILVVIVLLCWIVRKIRYLCGKKAPSDIEVNVWPISNSRYMDVNDMKVVNYDCWYYKGNNDTSRSIQITGRLSYTPHRYAKKFVTHVEYRIEDPDSHKAFSFRPDGREPNGGIKSLDKWYDATVNNGEFEILCTSFVKDGQTPDFTNIQNNILKMKVVARLSLRDKSGNIVVEEKAKVEKYYSFIVRQEISNSNLWMAFDPGTSGSCVAYGQGGMPDDIAAIMLAQNRYQEGNNWHESCIFPSKIRITDDSSLFNPDMTVENAKECVDNIGDFYFGNKAEMYAGRNTFQSIKKLLGYTDRQEIKANDGRRRNLTGEELAYLLVKGLCNHFEDHLRMDNSNATMKNAFFGGPFAPNAPFQPSRAIVAVPNNYTMVKVQDMVNTIKRTALFEEVHYIYESEGVLMTYLQHNWANLDKVEDKLIIVFDMGGATINATAFKIKVTMGNNNGNCFIQNVCVDTMAKIGFGVGGDDIDFAFIKIVLSAPNVRDKIGDEKEFMLRHKKGLLDMAHRLKFDYIDKQNHPRRTSGANVFLTADTLCTYLVNIFSKWNCPDILQTKQDYEYIWKQLDPSTARPMINEYVMTKVSDAINELFMGMATDQCHNSEVELILSGRSTLYPGIKDLVIKSINSTNLFTCQGEWKGFTKDDGELDDEKVKSCVANGACWYAMFSRYITLKHSILTSTLGYIDMVNNKSKFVPLLTRNKPFDEYGECESDSVAPQNPILNTVQFLQMFGSDYDKIYGDKIKHKYDTLLTILPNEIQGNIKDISIKVDDKNNFSCRINIHGRDPIERSYTIRDNEIANDNSEGYSFAALQSADDDTITSGTSPSTVRQTRF